MAEVTAGTKCGLRHPFNKGKRKNCENIQKIIAQTCAGLNGINPHLFKACEGFAQMGKSVTQEEFLCGVIGPDVLWGQYELQRCGYNPKKDSLYGQEFEKQEEEAFYMQQLPVILLALLILFLIYYLLFKVIK